MERTLLHAFTILLFMLTSITQISTLDAMNYDLSGLGCDIQISSIGNEPVSEFYLNSLNRTIHECSSKLVNFYYTKESQREESLRDLNEIFFPLLTPISHFTGIVLSLYGAKGISVDFKIPNFFSQSSNALNLYLIDFRLVHNDGSEVRESAKSLLNPSPFYNQQNMPLNFNKGNRYHTNTCPLIFNRAYITQIQLLELTDSNVKYNMLGFEPTNRTLNSTIQQLVQNGYRLKFDSTVFPLAVFSKTESVLFIGTLNSFEAAALRKSKLETVGLAISRLRRFFHNNPGWLNEANNRATLNPLNVFISNSEGSWMISSDGADISYISWIESRRINQFDDSSFCIFYQIKNSSLNVFFTGDEIVAKASENCTCLLLWIFSNLWPTDNRENLEFCYNNSSLMILCDYEKMSQKCSIDTIKPVNYRTIYDTILDLEFFKYLADVWLTPVASLFGIIANFLVIRTFRKIKRSPEYRRNKLTDKSRFMWDYTYYNSWFILLHGLVFLVGPLTTCIELTGIYCSPFIFTNFFRPFSLFVGKFLGNTFRLAANMSSTLFVLYRFGLNTDKLVRFRKVKPKVANVCLVISSFSISVITLFASEKFTIHKLFSQPFEYLLHIELGILESSLSLKIVYFLNIFLGTTLFTLSNMLIDLRLLFFLRSQNIDRPKEEAERRITKMVILNGLFSFLFRLPEMISAALLLMFTFDPKSFSVCIISDARYHSVCPMLFSISHFLLTFNYLENLILLYLFNSNFRKHFLNLKY
nr:G protein-coupled receptor [Proales similis]